MAYIIPTLDIHESNLMCCMVVTAYMKFNVSLNMSTILMKMIDRFAGHINWGNIVNSECKKSKCTKK